VDLAEVGCASGGVLLCVLTCAISWVNSLVLTSKSGQVGQISVDISTLVVEILRVGTSIVVNLQDRWSDIIVELKQDILSQKRENSDRFEMLQQETANQRAEIQTGTGVGESVSGSSTSS